MVKKIYVTHKREPCFDIAQELIGPTDRVLDIGPGNSNFADHCGRGDFYFFEGNPESVKELEKKHQNVYLGILPELPFTDEYFDLIHMSHVIEHLQPEEVYQTLKELNRCCKPGGGIVISAPLMWEGFYDDLSHVRPYGPVVLRKYLCDGSKFNLSRPAISKDFKVERLEYRYREKGSLYFLKNSKNFIGTSLYKAHSFLRKRGLQRYNSTGYTIVLRKNLSVNI